MNTHILKPRYRFGNPPKSFNKKKSIGVFCCIRSDLKCLEIIRARINSFGEVYLMPIESIEGGMDFHLSYHVSGKFHWTHEKKHLKPLYGESDYRMAFRKWLRFKIAPCFCIRKGKNLSKNELRILLSTIRNYLPFNYDLEEASTHLEDKSFYRVTLKKRSLKRATLLRLRKTVSDRVRRL